LQSPSNNALVAAVKSTNPVFHLRIDYDHTGRKQVVIACLNNDVIYLCCDNAGTTAFGGRR
jgi:hypothetical protein